MRRTAILTDAPASGLRPSAGGARLLLLLASALSGCELLGDGGGGGLGTHVAFVRDQGLWIAGDDGTGERRLMIDVTGVDDPAMSADGRDVAFSRAAGTGREIWRVSALGGTPEKVAARDADSQLGAPAWSPDGLTLAFHDEKDGKVYTAPADGSGEAQLLGGQPDAASFPSYKPPAGTAILVLEVTLNATRLHLVSSGAAETVVTGEASAPLGRAVFSPFGSKIAFSKKGTGDKTKVWVMAADGTGELELPGTAEDDVWPTWSPDGTQIAFASAEGGLSNIYVIASDGTGRREIRIADGQKPTWGP